MDSSKSTQRPPGPGRTILLSVALFLLLDTALFRSGLYARIASPDTVAGKVNDIVHFNRVARSDPSCDVLLLGSSKTEWGFGTDEFATFFPSAQINPIMAASPGSNEEWWYYELLAIDLHHDRYRAIVIPIEGYRVGPRREDKENDYVTAQALAPMIGLAEWPGFVMSFPSAGVRLRVLTLALFTSHAYSLDVQDLLLHPMDRVSARAERNEIGQRWLHDNHGASGDLHELIVDPHTRKPVAYPGRFDHFKRLETDHEFEAPSAEEAQTWTARNAAFETRWLGRMVAAYRGSRTRLVFINIPHAPVPLPAQEPIAEAPDVRAMIPEASNVTVVPEDAFTGLERPAFFADILHLNAVGHRAFTLLLGQRLVAILRPEGGADTSRRLSSE